MSNKEIAHNVQFLDLLKRDWIPYEKKAEKKEKLLTIAIILMFLHVRHLDLLTDLLQYMHTINIAENFRFFAL